MIGAVLDTNVLVSGIAHPYSVPGTLIAAWVAGAFELISEFILTEVRRALDKPYFRARLTAQQATDNIALLRREGELVAITSEVAGVAPDDADDQVLATAISGRADYLVTGDQGLLALSQFEGVRIISPRVFLEVLAASAEP